MSANSISTNQPVVAYSISPSNPNGHIFTVNIVIKKHIQQHLNLELPAWLPGSYMIRDFAKNIITFSVKDSANNAIEFHKTDKQSWRLYTQGKAINIEYQVYAFDLSVRTAYIDNLRGFFNGSSTFLEVKELSHLPCTLHINPPSHIGNWRVATGLQRADKTDLYQFGKYIADDYHHLIDCPVEMGNFDVIEFEVDSIPHYLVFSGRHFGDKERLKRDLAKLCKHHINLFGEAPFSEYWFITNLLGQGFGGLEHKNSTILVASRFDLPNPNKPLELSDNYKTFLSLCSHEYFHAWNVCRIKPEEFVPYDLSKEVHTSQLWAYEGITSYYDDFSLYRAGIIDFESYLALLSKTMTRVHRGDGELKQSVKESSFDTWTKFYQQGADAVNNIVSYYTKGSLVALWLDLTIRDKSQGKYSLDDMMRKIWCNHGLTGIGTNEQDFINALNEFSGEDLSTEFSLLLNSAQRIELSNLLNQFGVELKRTSYKALNTFDANTNSTKQAYFGAFYKAVDRGLQVTAVEQGSPAETAGLSVNDVIIAIDNIKIDDTVFKSLLSHLPINSTVNCHLFRDDLLLETDIKFVEDPSKAIALNVTHKDKALAWQLIK